MKVMYDKEDGSIGIGSLIIFIALMVVAAIAAAVIVGTVSSMRDRAYGAANSADHMVNGNVWNVQFVGYRASSTGPITKIQISFSVVSESIDLNKTIIEYTPVNHPPVYFRLNYHDPNTATGELYSADVRAFGSITSHWDPGAYKFWVAPGDLVVINITLGSGMEISQGQHVLITILPDPGAPYPHTIIAPADFGTETAITL